jgi:hypothetical protein
LRYLGQQIGKNQATDLFGSALQSGIVVHIQAASRTTDQADAIVAIQEVAEGGRADNEPGWHRQPRAGHTAETGSLTTRHRRLAGKRMIEAGNQHISGRGGWGIKRQTN